MNLKCGFALKLHKWTNVGVRCGTPWKPTPIIWSTTNTHSKLTRKTIFNIFVRAISTAKLRNKRTKIDFNQFRSYDMVFMAQEVLVMDTLWFNWKYHDDDRTHADARTHAQHNIQWINLFLAHTVWCRFDVVQHNYRFRKTSKWHSTQ